MKCMGAQISKTRRKGSLEREVGKGSWWPEGGRVSCLLLPCPQWGKKCSLPSSSNGTLQVPLTGSSGHLPSLPPPPSPSDGLVQAA